MSTVLRYTAFSTDPNGGNPAGVVLDARSLDDAAMQAIAREVGYSETAFLQRRDDGSFDVRYFSPLAEVNFCGHATIAAMVAHAHRHGEGERLLHTRAGLVRVHVDHQRIATLVSVAPRMDVLTQDDLDGILAALHWSRADLDQTLLPGLAYAGNWHPVLPVATRTRLSRLSYDFHALGELMAARNWTTVSLIWRENPSTYHARNPFPPGGVVEDPATGAAAAALGAYLASRDFLPGDRRFVIHQGNDMGRPSMLSVHVPQQNAGIEVSGTATEISFETT